MQTTIFVCAPEGHSWPLDVATVVSRLAEYLPDVQITPPKQEGVTGQTYISFEFALGNEIRHGNFFDHSQLTLQDGSPEDWAGTIAWFLGLLPSGAPAVAMVEVNYEDVVPIPQGADAATIQALLDGLTGAAR